MRAFLSPEWIKAGLNQLAPRLLAVVATTLLTAACATEPAADAVAASPGQEVVCQSRTVTGSNLPRRVCRTQDEWDALARAERRISDEFGRQSSENSTIVQPGSSRGLPTAL